jgi:hypothetical protein
MQRLQKTIPLETTQIYSLTYLLIMIGGRGECPPVQQCPSKSVIAIPWQLLQQQALRVQMILGRAS